jgi:hypothetical protein
MQQFRLRGALVDHALNLRIDLKDFIDTDSPLIAGTIAFIAAGAFVALQCMIGNFQGAKNGLIRMILGATVLADFSYQPLSDDTDQGVCDHIRLQPHIPQSGDTGDA